MKRVAILANTFEPVFGGTAGGHIHFIEVVRRWPNVEIVVFAPEEARATMSRELPKAKFVAMPSSDLHTNIPQVRNLVRVVLGLTRLSEIRRCDVVLATSHFLPDLAPAFAARPRNVVVCIHHVLSREPGREENFVARYVSLTFQALAFFLVRKLARAVVVNDPAAAQAAGIRNNAIRVFQMRHGIEHVSQVASAANAGFSIVYVGRLVPSKGIDDLLRAWKIVSARFPTATLAIAGQASATFATELRNLAATLGITERVRFLGWLSDDDKIALLSTARVFAFPSKEEGWGIVLAEAMAQGLPCVTYDLPAFRRDFTRGRLIAPLGNIESFAQHLMDLLSEEQFRLRMGAEARALAQTFSWDDAARVEFDALSFAARAR